MTAKSYTNFNEWFNSAESPARHSPSVTCTDFMRDFCREAFYAGMRAKVEKKAKVSFAFATTGIDR